ncbi:Ldh family oxidoreductase [Starkeya koreensis]|uniref:Ldh family oxidoreductase n=1 Tax=Ancylobacter koreensis TaxID=266121 RepID=A0ABT0DR03_9HYPH|nr:Ldh family oxidoreductase [Ancylobacter koreensis]MCK0209711.1 Ldh family oxidoreductase [Ancylobacter koreensis]
MADKGAGTEARRFSADTLTRFATEAMRACGLPQADAAQVADLIVESDLNGADAHGIFRIPQYVRRLRGGAVTTRPNIVVERTGPGTARVDGDNGMGHLVMHRAATMAVELAREAGIGWVGVRRSNHAGPASLYASIPLAHGMIGMYSAVASANHMAVWGGSEPLLGTNPLAIAIPAGEEPPVVLDIATTAVSYGTIKSYALNGRQLPEGWMIERATGLPLTDPARSDEGVLEPIGGYKGSGLALVLGLLAGTLNGAAFGREVVDFNADSSTETNTGHFIMALDVARFLPLPAFRAAVDAQLRSLRDTARLPGVEAIRLPGADRVRRYRERSGAGVPVPAPLLARLDGVARELAIAPLSLPAAVA